MKPPRKPAVSASAPTGYPTFEIFKISSQLVKAGANIWCKLTRAQSCIAQALASPCQGLLHWRVGEDPAPTPSCTHASCDQRHVHQGHNTTKQYQ